MVNQVWVGISRRQVAGPQKLRFCQGALKAFRILSEEQPHGDFSGIRRQKEQKELECLGLLQLKWFHSLNQLTTGLRSLAYLAGLGNLPPPSSPAK